MSALLDPKTYHRKDCVVLYRAKEPFGGLINMCGGYPLTVGGVEFRSSEALYQAMRFPHLPEVQKLIIAQTSPMASKMVAKPFMAESRPDWMDVRLPIMGWVMKVKMVQHWDRITGLLRESGTRPIVEESKRDDFWGAKPVGEDLLVGSNALGVYWMLNRIKMTGMVNRTTDYPQVKDLILLGQPLV